MQTVVLSWKLVQLSTTDWGSWDELHELKSGIASYIFGYSDTQKSIMVSYVAAVISKKERDKFMDILWDHTGTINALKF